MYLFQWLSGVSMFNWPKCTLVYVLRYMQDVFVSNSFNLFTVKIVSRPSYLTMGIFVPGKMVVISKRAQTAERKSPRPMTGSDPRRFLTFHIVLSHVMDCCLPTMPSQTTWRVRNECLRWYGIFRIDCQNDLCLLYFMQHFEIYRKV